MYKKYFEILKLHENASLDQVKCLAVIASFNLIWNTKQKESTQAMTNYTFSCFSC